MNTITQKLNSQNLIQVVEKKYLSNKILEYSNTVKIGNIVRIAYLIPEGNKERTQYYEGLIISINNKGLGKSFTLRRTVQGVGIEQIFLLNSPKIVSITLKQRSKVRRAKLYFIRELRGKSTKLKVKL